MIYVFFSGHKSIGESLMKSFGLSQEEVMRLMSNKSVRKSTILKKLKLLTEYGFRKDQITARIIRYNAKGIQYFFRRLSTLMTRCKAFLHRTDCKGVVLTIVFFCLFNFFFEMFGAHQSFL